MRLLRSSIRHVTAAGSLPFGRQSKAIKIGLWLLLTVLLLPASTFAARQPTGQSGGIGPGGGGAAGPQVTGSDFVMRGPALAGDPGDVKEGSLASDLKLPAGKTEATFTSNVTKAPMDFTDVGPHWWADTPDGTSVLVELRTSKDGTVWGDWQEADLEDILSPEDSPTETFASLISVDQSVRTNRYIQSRVTLQSAKAGVSPVFHELTYTFINAGVTAVPPRPQVQALGNPGDPAKPALVSREAWGAPEGESSPTWAPKYRRVTHIVIHHTATPNTDGDFAARVRAVWYFHAHTRGWGDIGYNYVVDPNGVIYEGRAGGDDVEAGHAYPFNTGTMGIGMLGNFMKVAPSAAAQAALVDLISWKANQRGIDPLAVEPIKGYTDCGTTITYNRPTIAGHRDYRGTACGKAFNTSTCPGDVLYNMLPQIRAAVVTEQPALRAVFLKHDTPGNLQPGGSVNVHLNVRNSGSLTWQKDGQGSVSIGYRWLTPDGQALPSGPNEAKVAVSRDVPFADAITMTVKLSVPKNPGHYALIWDMYRDGQGWFADQGSHPLRVDVVVGNGIGDTIPPTSEVLPLPMYTSNQQIAVRWAGKDDAKGSGLVSYDIQYRLIPQGTWTDWKMGTADTQATLEGQDGYTYGFRSRARDSAGNVEAWRDDPDAYTTVDTTPPTLKMDTPRNGEHVKPGPLLVRGRTEPGTFVAVNDQRADEANGVFTSTVDASGRDFVIHVTAADAAGNLAQVELTVQAAPRYTDVPMDNPNFLAIEYLSDQGVVSGYGDGTFRPDQPITRAQLLKTLATALHWGLITPQEARFTDVVTGTWMYPYVETAAARGVMDGYSDGTFKPNNSLTKGQTVKTLVKAAGWKLVYPSSGPFLDIPPRSELFPYVETAFVHRTVSPDAEGYFRPSEVTSRGQVAQMVYGLLVDMMENTPPNPGDDQGTDTSPR